MSEIEMDTPKQTKKKNRNNFEYKCNICQKRFLDKSSLHVHKKIHTTGTPYSCDLCSYAGKTAKYLGRHVRRAHTEPTLPCDVCGKLFHFRSKMMHHMLVHSGEKPYKCKVCGKAFNSNYSLKTHKLIHENLKPFRCSMCDYACRDSSTLRKHQDRHLGKVKVFPCKLCDKALRSKTDLRLHMDEKHFGINRHSIPCDICGKMFKTNSVLSTHINTVHARRYACECEICGVVCLNKSNMEKHMRTHVDIRPYKCTYEHCGKKFKQLGDLKKHIVTHQPERQHACPTCGRRFARAPRLRRHLAQHRAKRRPARCQRCPARFYNNNYLMVHMRKKHGGERYVCDECGFETGNKPSIVMHIKYGHAAETDRVCQICNKSFKRHMYLKLHYWNTHCVKYKALPRVKRKKVLAEEIQVKQEAESAPEMELELEVHKEEVFSDLDEQYENAEDAFQKIEEDYRELEQGYQNGEEETEYSKRVLSEDVTRVLGSSKDKGAEKHPEQVIDELMLDKIAKSAGEDSESNEQIFVEFDPVLEMDARRCLEELVSKSKRKRQLKELEETRRLYNQRMKDAMNRKPKAESTIIKFVNIKKRDAIAVNENELSVDDHVDSPKTNQNDVTNVNYTVVNENDEINEVNEINENNDTESLNNTDFNGADVKETDSNDNEVKDAQSKSRNGKLKINSHQCYVCFKLFETKTQLIEHCKVHFDVCSSVMLKKCPLCDYVTKRNLLRHMRSVHKLTIKVPYARIKDKMDNQNGSRYYYDIENDVVDHVEVIPSVRNLNKRECVKIDKKSREEKDRCVAKTKLVKKGGEWVVEKEKIEVKEDFILPEFDVEDILKIKENGDDYLGRMKKLSRLAKKNGSKMMFPCESCEKICQTLSALKLHSRRHNPNAKPFKPKVWKHKMKRTETAKEMEKPVNTGNRYADPKPITNKHKCDPKLRDFYEKNIKGGDIEFWQFLKIFNKMSRENVSDFCDLQNRTDFGIHYDETPLEPVTVNLPQRKRVKRTKKPCFVRRIKISKTEYSRRKELQNKLRESISNGCEV